MPSPVPTTFSDLPGLSADIYDNFIPQTLPNVAFPFDFDSLPFPQPYNNQQSLHDNNTALASTLDSEINNILLYQSSTTNTWQEPDNSGHLQSTFAPPPSSGDAMSFISPDMPAQPGGIYDNDAVIDAIGGDFGDDSSEGFFQDDDDEEEEAQPSSGSHLVPGNWLGASLFQPAPAGALEAPLPPPMQDIGEGFQSAGQFGGDFWMSASSVVDTTALEAGLFASPMSTEEFLAILPPEVSPSPLLATVATPTTVDLPYPNVTFVVDSGAPRGRKRSRETEESGAASTSTMVEGSVEFRIPITKLCAAIKLDKDLWQGQTFSPQQWANFLQVSDVKSFCRALFLREQRKGTGQLLECGLCPKFFKTEPLLRRHVQHEHGAKWSIGWLVDGEEPLSSTELISILHIAFASSLRQERAYLKSKNKNKKENKKEKEKAQDVWNPAWTAAEREAIERFGDQFPSIDAPNVDDFELTPLLEAPVKRWARWLRWTSTCQGCWKHLSRPDVVGRHRLDTGCGKKSLPEHQTLEAAEGEDDASEYTGPPQKRVKHVHS